MFETMLLVDDSGMEREMLTELLQNSFTILTAASGAECMDVIETCQGHIDVVLLDLMMPDMTGFDVLEKRRELEYFAKIPVIVLTASNAIEDQVKSFEYGANDFISKPIIPDIAVSRINNVLASKRRLDSILEESESYKTKAELDMLTGLYNKITTEEQINQFLLDRPNDLCALMIMDIDNFKAVNDIEGHQEGDHTLRIIANLISTQFRNSDIVGRIGGDEFVVFMTGLPSKDIARRKAEDIVRLMKYKPNLTIPTNVSLSVGLTFSERELTDYPSLFKKADQALYKSKKEGKARLNEYGKEEEKYIDMDDREIVILCSRVRSICSVMEEIIGKNYRFIPTISMDELKIKVREVKQKVTLLCIDVSDELDDGDELWDIIGKDEIMNQIPVLAVCKEGNMKQYRKAIAYQNTQDMVTAPLEVDQLRRIMKNMI